MIDMDNILENRMINSWIRHFTRCPGQINRLHESDAELVEIPGNSSHLLAVSIDSIAEEIASGVYEDPFTIGWVAVMANFSDLAAVGAEPLGIVIAVSLEPSQDEKFSDGIAKGIAAACREISVFLLGGDTNTSQESSLTGCAFGLVPRHGVVMRSGCSPGDIVFLSNGAGSGNALGLVKLAKLPAEYFQERLYRPSARIREGQLIRKFASCCMDTSDGVLIAIDQLRRINGHGFVIDADWKKILAEEVSTFCERAHIPHWLMAAGIQGEFELVFTVSPLRVDSFLEAASGIGFHPIRIGVVENNPTFRIVLSSGKQVEIDMTPLRNLWVSGDGNLDRLLREHHSWGRMWGLE